MTNTNPVELVKATANPAIVNTAKKTAKALKEKQRRAAVKVSKREATKTELVQRSENSGLILPGEIEFDEVGRITRTLGNCYRLLESQPWGFGYDMLAQANVCRGDVIWPDHYGRTLDDPLILKIRMEFLQVFGVEFSTLQVRDALYALCRANPFHPVVEYLGKLEWDGEKRVEKWLSKYLSAEDSEYTRAVGGLWLMAAVARAKQPGIKFDNMPIFEGPQGSEKSGALAVLGGDWFSDAELGDLKNKEAAINLQGVWLYEFAELGSMPRSDVKDVKAFLSRVNDKFREPFGTTATLHPRNCVFAGTDNLGKDRGYLRDDTGNRRIWPVVTGKVYIDNLANDRDQLWAEAAKLWDTAAAKLGKKSARALVLPSKLWAVAGDEQKARLLVDPWVEQLKPWLDNPFHERPKDYRGFDGRKYEETLEPYMKDGKLTKIHSRILLAECLHIPPGSQTPEVGRKLRAAMAQIEDWEFDANLTVGAIKGVSGYRRTTGEPG